MSKKVVSKVKKEEPKQVRILNTTLQVINICVDNSAIQILPKKSVMIDKSILSGHLVKLIDRGVLKVTPV